MARGQTAVSHAVGIGVKSFKFDMAVTHHARIGSSTALIGLDKIAYDGLFKFPAVIGHVMDKPQTGGHGRGVSYLKLAAAGDAVRVGAIVQTHGHARADAPLLKYKVGGHGAIYTAAHGDQRFRMHGVHRPLRLRGELCQLTRFPQALKIVLAQDFVYGDGHRVGKIQTAQSVPHRETHRAMVLSVQE